MPDFRLGYSVSQHGARVCVIDPKGEVVCEIPLTAAAWLDRVRSDQERWDIAQTLARLLNEESAACRRAARNQEIV